MCKEYYMSGVRTAISIEEELFKEINKMAKHMKISRSRLISEAVRDYLKKQENIALLSKLNEVYSDDSLDEERRHMQLMRKHHRKLVESESW